jgi:Arc/MetJ-type ribon-helix-helix transcriptional regulator
MGAVRSVVLPEELCAAAEQKFAHRFGSVDELVGELLRQLLQENALAMDEKEQHIIEERLKGLGYI